uniref:Uncharacterized protein n=1 Tax=viral metagenome TaxID=1070528 RepID=A0A6M3JKN0_9ZZZZ
MTDIKTVGELKKFLSNFEDSMLIGLDDPNFSGFYHEDNPYISIKYDEELNALTVWFPFEEPVD